MWSCLYLLLCFSCLQTAPNPPSVLKTNLVPTPIPALLFLLLPKILPRKYFLLLLSDPAIPSPLTLKNRMLLLVFIFLGLALLPESFHPSNSIQEALASLL